MKSIGKAIVYFLIYLGITMFFQVLGSVGFMAIGAASGIRDEASIIEFANNNILGITVISGLLTVLALYLIFRVQKKQVKQEWKLNPFRIRDVVLASVISFAFSFLFALCTYHVSMENSVLISKSVDFYSEISPLLGFALMAINLLAVAPASEEIALRGIVYTRAEKTANPLTAILVSSALFGAMHAAAGGAILVIGAMLMAAVFGFLFYKFESLWVCIIAHAAANLPDFILYNRPDISGGLFWGLAIFFVCVFSAGVIAAFKIKQPGKI